MRNVARAVLAGGLGFAVALVVAACGGSGVGLLSGDQANSLQSQLDQISAALSSGNCGAASSGADGLLTAVGNLPASVSAGLRNNLNQGATTVGQLARQQCRQATTTTTPTTTARTTTSTTTAPHTTTTTESTTTSPPTTTTSETTPTTPGNTPTSGGAGLSGGGQGGAGAGGGNGNNGQ